MFCKLAFILSNVMCHPWFFQEEAKLLRKRNTKVFNDILDSMPDLTNQTTWSEAQQMLLDNPRFTEDPELQSEYS